MVIKSQRQCVTNVVNEYIILTEFLIIYNITKQEKKNVY